MTFLFICIFFTVCFGCTFRSSISYKNRSAKTVLQEYQKQYKKIRTFQAQANITLTSYNQQGELQSDDIKAKIAWNKNDSLALKLTYSFFNIDISQIFVGKDSYIFTSRQDKEDIFVRGFPNDGYLNQAFHIHIPLEKWGEILFLGNIPLDTNSYEKKILPSGELYLIYPSKQVTFQTNVLFPGRISYLIKNIPLYNISFQKIIKVNNFLLPEKIIYQNNQEKSELTIEYHSIIVNKKLDMNLFEIKIPSNLRQIDYEPKQNIN